MVFIERVLSWYTCKGLRLGQGKVLDRDVLSGEIGMDWFCVNQSFLQLLLLLFRLTPRGTPECELYHTVCPASRQGGQTFIPPPPSGSHQPKNMGHNLSDITSDEGSRWLRTIR